MVVCVCAHVHVCLWECIRVCVCVYVCVCVCRARMRKPVVIIYIKIIHITIDYSTQLRETFRDIYKLAAEGKDINKNSLNHTHSLLFRLSDLVNMFGHTMATGHIWSGIQGQQGQIFLPCQHHTTSIYEQICEASVQHDWQGQSITNTYHQACCISQYLQLHVCTELACVCVFTIVRDHSWDG